MPVRVVLHAVPGQAVLHDGTQRRPGRSSVMHGRFGHAARRRRFAGSVDGTGSRPAAWPDPEPPRQDDPLAGAALRAGIEHRRGRQQCRGIGMTRRIEDLAASVACSTIRPAYITATGRRYGGPRSGRAPMKISVRCNSSCRSRSRFRICACTETSSADTASSQITTRGLHRQCTGDADALPLAAAERVRITPHMLRRAVPHDAPDQRPDPAVRGRLATPFTFSGSPMMSATVMRGSSDE